MVTVKVKVSKCSRDEPMVSNYQPTILELQQCCSMLIQDIDSALADGYRSSVEIRTCQSALVAVTARLQDLLDSTGQTEAKH